MTGKKALILPLSDIRATDPGRWNSWKGALLGQLYRSTQQALAREEIPIFGDPQQTRSFSYRDDLLDGLIHTGNILEGDFLRGVCGIDE